MMQLKESLEKRFRNSRGFTLIEVIAVLVILSIIAVAVISREGSTANTTLKSSAEALKSHISFTQMRALNSDASNCAASFGMTISGTGYSMFRITNTCLDVTNLVLPGAENTSGVTLPSGMSVSATPSPLSTFTFDRWGIPHPDAIGTATSSTISLTISYAGMSEPITITKNTGFVP
jgi:prepilin-type N-terminal cleavage/methylation domain-containing protein